MGGNQSSYNSFHSKWKENEIVLLLVVFCAESLKEVCNLIQNNDKKKTFLQILCINITQQVFTPKLQKQACHLICTPEPFSDLSFLWFIIKFKH